MPRLRPSFQLLYSIMMQLIRKEIDQFAAFWTAFSDAVFTLSMILASYYEKCK